MIPSRNEIACCKDARAPFPTSRYTFQAFPVLRQGKAVDALLEARPVHDFQRVAYGGIVLKKVPRVVQIRAAATLMPFDPQDCSRILTRTADESPFISGS